TACASTPAGAAGSSARAGSLPCARTPGSWRATGRGSDTVGAAVIASAGAAIAAISVASLVIGYGLLAGLWYFVFSPGADRRARGQARVDPLGRADAEGGRDPVEAHGGRPAEVGAVDRDARADLAVVGREARDRGQDGEGARAGGGAARGGHRDRPAGGRAR